jgi:hypothetical protein
MRSKFTGFGSRAKISAVGSRRRKRKRLGAVQRTDVADQLDAQRVEKAQEQLACIDLHGSIPPDERQEYELRGS